MVARILIAVLLLDCSAAAAAGHRCILANGDAVHMEQDLSSRFPALVKSCTALPATVERERDSASAQEPPPATLPIQTIVAERPATHAAVAARFEHLVADSALRHDLDPRLVHAIIRAESAYTVRAHSRKGARGLMQVMPATAARFGIDPHRLWDPAANIDAGTRYLGWLQRVFSGRLDLQIAAYNAGEGAVQRYGNQVPPYRETREYVRKVLGLYRGQAGAAR